MRAGMWTRCAFCQRAIQLDPTPQGNPDWKTDSGDYGCDDNPISGPEGVGPHVTMPQLKALYQRAEEEWEAGSGVYTRQAFRDAVKVER